MYLLKLAFRPWKRYPLNQFLTLSSISFLVFLIGLLVSLDYGFDQIVLRLQQEQVLTAYLSPALEAAQEYQIVDQIKTTLASAENLKVQLIEKETFLNQLKLEHSELVNELIELGQDMEKVVPHYVSISGSLPENRVEQLRSIKGVDQIDTSLNRFQHVVSAFQTMGVLAEILVLGLLVTGFVAWFHMSRTHAILFSDLVGVFRILGGTHLSYRLPVFIYGICFGFACGMMAGGAWMLWGHFLIEQIRNFSFLFSELKNPISFLEIYLLGGSVLFGALSGFFGSPAALLENERNIR